MSIIHSLKRLVDPIAHQQEEASRKFQQQQVDQEQAGDPPRFRCRVCGHEGRSRVYCPACLADTMDPADVKEESE